MSDKKKLRTLLADDENHIRVMLRSVMTSMTAEIVGEAKNGQEAIDLYQKERPDLLLLDINMPIKTGEEVLKEIISEFPNACVIMLSSTSDRKTVQRCIDMGAANYILKNVPLAEMKIIIKDTWASFKKSKEISNV